MALSVPVDGRLPFMNLAWLVELDAVAPCIKGRLGLLKTLFTPQPNAILKRKDNLPCPGVAGGGPTAAGACSEDCTVKHLLTR